LFSFAVTATTAAGTALVLGVGAFQVIEGALTLGQLLVILSYIAAVYGPLDTLVSSATPLHSHIVDLRRAFALLDEPPGIVDEPDAEAIGRAKGRIEFDSVSFSHPGRSETLTGVSFTADPGTVTAVVGPTGAGKTTLTSLMPRLHDPGHGVIRLDGRDIRSITLESLRRQFSLVLQDTLLFAATVRENVAYGDPDASEERVVEAARAAGAHDFITALPDGYDTLVGDGGRGLSGGERQRIAIARAFLRDAPILILDEPTSAVDGRTESGILRAMESLAAGRTTFIVAHRLSTVRDADQILVLDDGRVVERGRHDELMENGGLYRRLAAGQPQASGHLGGPIPAEGNVASAMARA
jgi:ABC-type multidrug transport system fused ATPase/permease subunit